MSRFARGVAAVLGVASAVIAVFLIWGAAVSENQLVIAWALLMALQGLCLLWMGMGRNPWRLFRRAILWWCLVSGLWLLLTTQSYIRNHGLESWVDAAGGSGFVTASGEFVLSMPPMSREHAAIAGLIVLSQGASALLLWRRKAK